MVNILKEDQDKDNFPGYSGFLEGNPVRGILTDYNGHSDVFLVSDRSMRSMKVCRRSGVNGINRLLN